MADERKYYVLCEDNCKFESMTKEQILTAIAQAIETGAIRDVDTGFITKLKELNSGVGISLWVGSMAKFNALEEKPKNCICIFTDDTTEEDLFTIIEEMQKHIETLQNNVYMVEQGTSGIWTYEKWSNGVAKCWATFPFDMKTITFLKDPNNTNKYKPAYSCVENAFCNYETGLIFPKDLFVDAPFVNYDAANGNGMNGLSFGRGMAKGAKALASKDCTGTLWVDFPLGVNENTEWKITNDTTETTTYTFLAGGYVPCQISVEAKGRWR